MKVIQGLEFFVQGAGVRRRAYGFGGGIDLDGEEGETLDVIHGRQD